MLGQPAGVSHLGTADAAPAGGGGLPLPAPGGEPRQPPAAIVAFLVRFSVALHKHSTYPPGHPTLVAADQAVTESLAPLFADRVELRVGVARQELVLDDEVTGGHPVLRELAERLHRRSVGGLMLRRGVTAEELADVLNHLSGDAQALRRRLLGEGEPLPEWPHVEVVAHAFRRLALAGSTESTAGESGHRLWLDLAAAAFAGEGDADSSMEAVARELDARAEAGGSATEVRRLLLTLGRAAREASGAERAAIDGRIRDLMGQLRPETLRWMFGEAGAAQVQMREAVDVLPADSVLLLLESASGKGDSELSNHMLRLLGKFARHVVAKPDGDDKYDGALRETARELIDSWTLQNPNPESHTYLLDALSRQDAATFSAQETPATEGQRLVQMALESGATGDHVLAAAEMMVEARQLASLLSLLEQAPASAATEVIRVHLRSPAMLRSVLLEEPVDLDAAKHLLAMAGVSEAPGLLDALEISESQDTRRVILERLAALGDGAAPVIAARLKQAPWYVQRNLLALLARVKALPAGFTARTWADSAEVTVRYHALGVMLRQPAERDEAIQLALSDADPRVVRFGLDAAAKSLPRTALPRLMALLNSHKPLELRTRGILLLQQVRTPAVRDWLLEKVLTKRTLLRGPRLHPKSPEVVMSLVVLARSWAGTNPASRALKLAAESGDAELAAAARGQEPAT